MGNIVGHVCCAPPEALTSWILASWAPAGEAAFSTVAVFPSGVATRVVVAPVLPLITALLTLVPAADTGRRFSPVGVGVAEFT